MKDGDTSATELSATHKRLLQHLIARKINNKPERGIDTVPTGTPIALCSAQARIWFMERIYPGSPFYNSCNRLYLERWPDRAPITDALRVLMKRHDALRLRIFEINEEPFQEVCDELEVPLTWHDLRELAVMEAQGRADEIAEHAARTLFQLEQAPLFRFAAILLPEGQAQLVSVFHHIVMDGWSVGSFYKELTQLLSGQPLELAPNIGYIDYLAWEQAHVDERDLASQLDYWRNKLSGELPVLDIPRDRPRPTAGLSFEGSVYNFSLSSSLIKRLREFAETEQTTLFTVLLAAYKVLLLRLTGQNDLIIGAPFAAREDPRAEPLLGCFANMVALRTDLAGNLNFREVVRRVRATTLEAYENQSVPFDLIVKELKIPRDVQYNPIFQVQFSLDNVTSVSALPGARLNDSEVNTGTSKFDLTLSVIETESGAGGCLEYSTVLFDRPTIRRYADMYVRMLEELRNHPDLPVSQHDLLGDDEKQRILFGLNKYERPDHHYRTMAEPFEEQVAHAPDAIALVGDEGSMSYAELNERANRLAHFLRAAGVGRGSFVAVCMERSFALIAALYAVAKSGAAYVPLDPELPAARISFMVEDTAPSLVLVDSAAKPLIPPGPWQVIAMDEDGDRWSQMPATNIKCDGPTHHLIHLLYTSGSTGRPKAVAYPINGAIAEIFWLHRSYPLQAGDANLFKTSYGFDVSIWEIFWTLYFGARLVICRPGGHRDPSYLVDAIERHGVTTIFLIPSMLEALLEELPLGRCRSLRWVFCGGAPVTPRLRDAFYARLNARLINCYGPTEAGCVTDMVIPPEPSGPTVPLGRPAANYRLYILNEKFEINPIGVLGEAYIAGEVGLAQCYYSRPDLTAERFLPDPFGTAGGRMYRTGDICRYREDGVLEHLGRSGRQVKVRGMRVELAEIEAVLCEHESVETCVVLAIEDQVGQRLLAFVVPRDETQFLRRELLEHASRFLPRYMVPASIVCVRRIPTTINGKVDSAALLERWRDSGPSITGEVVPAADENEEKLKRVFERVLGCEGFSVTDSFFDLGGHSLLVFKLISACAQELHYRPSVTDIFSAPSVRELCARMKTFDRSPGENLVPLFPSPGKPLIVFVHAASGSAMPFFEVGQHLKADFSIYALQASEGTPGGHEVTLIEQLAANYAEAVDSIRGLSPLIIAGWSMGGCVALEMARHWHQRGVDTAAILMLDTLLPPKALASADEREAARQAILDLDVLGEEGWALAQIAEASDLIARLERALDVNRRAFLEYKPDWFEAEVDYLRAAEPFLNEARNFSAVFATPDRGWGTYIQKVAVHGVAGHHFNLVAKENAESLAETIRSIAGMRLTFSLV